MEKLLFEKKLEEEDVIGIKTPTYLNLSKFAIDYSDAIIQSSKSIHSNISDYIKKSGKPFMDFPGEEDYEESYNNFFDTLVEEKELELSE